MQQRGIWKGGLHAAAEKATHRDLGVEERLERQRHAAEHLCHKQRVGAVIEDWGEAAK